jgi:hypothetical protein
VAYPGCNDSGNDGECALLAVRTILWPLGGESVCRSLGILSRPRSLNRCADTQDRTSGMRCNSCRHHRILRGQDTGLNLAHSEQWTCLYALRAQIGAATTASCLFDAEPDVRYAYPIHALDLIEQTPGRIVLLTPETKRSHIPPSARTRYRRYAVPLHMRD